MSDRLTPKAREALELSDEQRIARIKHTRWIGYERAHAILKKLDDLFAYPKKHRMPNLVLVGETNNGKTTIVNEFRSRHPAKDNRTTDVASVPVVVVQAPSTPVEARLYGGILRAIYPKMGLGSTSEKRLFQVLTVFEEIDVRVLVIDEIHNIIAGSMQRQRAFLNCIKYLGNELQIPIVGVGTMEALNALQSDPQLSNRFEPVTVPRWKLDDEYLRLLASFEHMLPLRKPSDLMEGPLASKILAMSEGTIGEIAAVLTLAAICAVESKAELIDAKLLDKVDYTSPSQRKRRAS